MRITDLDKFALEQVYRPYAPDLFTMDTRFDRMTKDYNLDTVLDLFKTNTKWHHLVMGRISRLKFEFPDYIKHPLVEHIKTWRPSPVLA